MMRAFIGVGSSIDPERNILRGLELLLYTERILKISNFYQNQAVSRPKDPPFWNGVVAIETSCTPRDLKYYVLRRVESECGRTRDSDSYSPRTLDLDILVYGNKVIREKGMVIPDPDIRSRPFIALPLYETEPLMILPDTGELLSDILRNMDVSGLKFLQNFSNEVQKRFPVSQKGISTANETFQHHKRGIFS